MMIVFVLFLFFFFYLIVAEVWWVGYLKKKSLSSVAARGKKNRILIRLWKSNFKISGNLGVLNSYCVLLVGF